MSDKSTFGAEFFEREIHDVARDLLGRELVRHIGDEQIRGQIVEVEVYEGPNDRASHARSGEPTERTAPMFGPPGMIYVYTIYGMYQCLNLRAPSSVGPGAILIRACRPVANMSAMAIGRGLIESPHEYEQKLQARLMSGPGKLCQALQIDTDLSGEMIGGQLALDKGRGIWREQPKQIEATPRRGLNRKTCGDCVDRRWRYVIAGSLWVS